MKQKIHLLYVADKAGFGGIQTIFRALASSTFPPDIEPYYLFLRDLDKRFNIKRDSNKKIIYAPDSGRYSISSFFTLLKTIDEYQIDIVHLNGNKSIIFGTLASFLRPWVKFIAQEHGVSFDYKKWYLLFLQIFQSRISTFISLSHHRKHELMTMSYIPKSKIIVLYNFVDLEKFKPKIDSLPRKYTFGYVGGLSQMKGWWFFLEALQQAKKHVPTISAVIAGDGPHREKVLTMIKDLGLEKTVTFLGFQLDSSVVYHASNWLVMPSLAEACPMVLFEAQASGTPVLCSDLPVLKEIIGTSKTVVFFPTADSSGLAKQMITVVNNHKLRSAIAKRALATVEQYSLPKYIQHLATIYRSIYDQ